MRGGDTVKLSKGLVTELLTQLVAIATIVISRYVAPDYLDIALAIVAAVEGVGNALVVYFVQQGKIEELRATVERVARGR